MSASTAVATSVDPAPQYALRSPVAQLLYRDSVRAMIEPFLRPGDSIERVIVETFHAAAKNADIMKCTTQSIVNAVSRAVRSGLVIGEGVHLVPYGTTLTEIYDYKGRIQLICNAGAARSIDFACVYEHEKFEYELGSAPRIAHSPIMSPAKRGAMIGAYAIAHHGHGRITPLVLSAEEIEKVRQTYSKTHKRGELPYWYAEKTCVHRLAKKLPKNPELAKVVALFEAEDQGIEEAALEDMPQAYTLSDGSKTLQIAGTREESGAGEGPIGGDAVSAGTGAAPSSDPSALATAAQKIRITELLSNPDLDLASEKIEEIAGLAGKRTYTAREAETQIAALEALLPTDGNLFDESL